MENPGPSSNSARHDFALLGETKKQLSGQCFVRFGELSAHIEPFLRAFCTQSFRDGYVDCRCVVEIEEMILENPINSYPGFDHMRCYFFAPVKDISIKIPAEIRRQIATG
jgi:hypothetical protein